MSLAFGVTTALAALFLLPLLFSAVGAQQQARACLTKDEEPPPGGLPNTPPVFFDKPQIVHKQKSYYVKIFSDTAQKPGQRFDQCFRYEAETEGPDPINAFYWELANGLWVDPMLKAERHSRKVVRPVDDEPRVMPTRVTAFENDAAQTQAWTVVPRRTAAASAPFQWVWPESIAGLPEFLQTHNLPPRPLTAFYLKETGATASTLEDVYSGPRINVALRSDARRSGMKSRYEPKSWLAAKRQPKRVISCLRCAHCGRSRGRPMSKRTTRSFAATSNCGRNPPPTSCAGTFLWTCPPPASATMRSTASSIP
jgi:hypothetical protein